MSDQLERYLSKVESLQSSLEENKRQLAHAKEQLITYFSQHPQESKNKYRVHNHIIAYKTHQQSEGLSQKVVLRGLMDYFARIGHNPTQAEEEAKRALRYILKNRKAKTVNRLDLKKV